MSLFVLAIAAGHAVPPIVGAILGKSKSAVYIGSGIASVIAIASGNPAFIAADLVGVGLGTWLGLSMLKNGSSNEQ